MYTSRYTLARICITFIFLQAAGLRAQAIRGIYPKATDYLAQQLSLEAGEGKQGRIRSGLFLASHLIRIRYGDSTYTFCKDSLYAYLDAEGRLFRFYRDLHCLLLNPGEAIQLYKYEYQELGKHPVTHTRYFFSRGVADSLHPLRLAELYRAFEDESCFRSQLLLHMHDERDLICYDKIRQHYTLNLLYEYCKNPIIPTK